jgi:hypothetical protein
MTTRPGRRAFFEAAAPDGPAVAVPMDDQRPLFSAPPRRAGTVVVVCSRCDARTPVRTRDVALPVSLSLLSPWWMFAEHPHLLRCPACAQRTWCRLD